MCVYLYICVRMIKYVEIKSIKITFKIHVQFTPISILLYYSP